MNKKLKSALSIGLVVPLILAGCGSKTQKQETAAKPEGSKELKGEISVQAEKDWVPYYQATIERIQKENPNVKINIIEKGSFDSLDILDKTDATNTDIADVFALPADRLHGLNDKQVLAKMDAEKMAEELGGFKDFKAGLGGQFNINGDYMAFPYNIETLVTFINTANAKANNVDITKPLELTKQKDASTILLPLFDAWYGVSATNSANIELLAKDESGKLISDFTKDLSELSKEKQDFIKAIYDYWKLNNDSKTPLFDADAGWGYIDEKFKTGSTGVARIGGPWDQKNFMEQAGAENLQVRPIGFVTINEKPLSHWKGGWGLGINSRIEKDADKMAIAEKLIKELVNPKYAVDLFRATGKILENVDVEQYKKSDLEDAQKAIIEAVIESYSTSPKRPLFKEWGKVWDTWKNAVLSWNTVKPADEKAAYKEIKASFDAMMKNF